MSMQPTLADLSDFDSSNNQLQNWFNDSLDWTICTSMDTGPNYKIFFLNV
jgi:hypothetical protein